MNYEFKGTPGPWIPVYDDNGFYCIVSKDSPYILTTGGEGDIDEANVRLASKAPEMFQMLQRAKQCFEALNEHSVMAFEIEELLKEATNL